MNILIISQCNKRALIETRKILDQFAERKGDKVWQTAITQQGLITLRKLLRKTAKRNTAVACHWIKSANRTELLWIVGNISRFNLEGTVPTNITSRDILRSQDENQWHTAEDILLLAAIAGFFHDFGKANKLFQKKMKEAARIMEPYRHEWVSLRLFEAFVANQTDKEWLERLSKVSEKDEAFMLANLRKDSEESTQERPFSSSSRMTKLAQTIAWLIVTHHRLPKSSKENCKPRSDRAELWMTRQFDGSWNSPQSYDRKWDNSDWKGLWSFPRGTPIKSKVWREKIQKLAKRALKRPELMSTDWMKDSFSLHLARLALMLSDHYYSSLPEPIAYRQDKTYEVFANTDKTGALKQKLDEHNIGVGINAAILGKNMPKLRNSLPAITRHKGFKTRSKLSKFRWQDKAYDLACCIRQRTEKHGFFGVNMASTGCGKTFANARIMYGLSDEKLGCRFSVALGLRTLTLQTGDALRDRLRLDDDALAVLVGSQATMALHNSKLEEESDVEKSGSVSAEDLLGGDQYVHYEGSLDDGGLGRYIKNNKKIHKLLSAPVLVSTIDYLMPATEGERGGKQIAPMLRLLTSDLVLDEPDDFNLEDLPALSRLVNWAGMLGARVLLSSATLPPALIKALFDSYYAGRKIYQQSVGEPNLSVNICCAWFDEYRVEQSDHAQLDSFMGAHKYFVDERVNKLSKELPLRQAEIVRVENDEQDKLGAISSMVNIIYKSIVKLHSVHHQMDKKSKKCVSIGLVRIANIKPLVAIAKALFAKAPPEGCRFHYCVYHSQFPIAARSYIEEQLDIALTRHEPDKIWEVESIKKAVGKFPEKNHIFIVIGSPVTEVGRDHDYDWAVIEPSSMRSIIQLAGRILRHRQWPVTSSNIMILSKNYKALCGESVAFCKPGFESTDFQLESKCLDEILLPEQIKFINAIPRIQESNVLEPSKSLIDLEHHQLNMKLSDGEGFYAALWWQQDVDWCFEMQRNTIFRKSCPDEQFVFHIENEEVILKSIERDGSLKKNECRFKETKHLEMAACVQPWFDMDYSKIISMYALRFEQGVSDTSLQVGEIRLRETTEQWHYHERLGVFLNL